MIEVVLFLLVSCLIIGTVLYGIYRIILAEKVLDDGTAFAVAFVILICVGLMWLNYGVFFPNEMNEYYIRAEAERIIQDKKLQERKVAAGMKKRAEELEIKEMMQKLKENKQNGA
jgi:hypothetical protein